jgi:hypothetical protein
VLIKFALAQRQNRSFRLVVWIGRAIGWALLLVVIVGIAEPPFKMLPSFAVWLMAVAWIVGLEQFFRFIDRYLSGN